MPPENERRPGQGAAHESRPDQQQNCDGQSIARPPVPFNLRGVPEVLRAQQRWAGWEMTAPRGPGQKAGKVPINPRTGNKASSTNPLTWGTLEEALKCMNRRGLAGVGFMFEGSGLAGIDLDHCRDPETGVIEPRALEIVQQFATYTEVSPSGTGIHLICRAKLPGRGRRRGKVEMYDAGRYFTITGVRVPDTPAEVTDRQTEVESLHREIFGPETETKESERSPDHSVLCGTDDEVILRAVASKNGAKFRALFSGNRTGYSSQSEADLALCSQIAFWSGSDHAQIDRIFRKSSLYRPKWDEKRGERTYGQNTVAKAVSGKMEYHSASGREPALSADRPEGRELTDSGNAERLVRQFGGDVRFCHPEHKWKVWSGTHWRNDNTGRPLYLSKKVARGLYVEAARCNNEKARDAIANWAHTSEKGDRRKAMVDLARCEPGISITPEHFDRHPYLLNCPNGTLDLRTLELRPHRREDYISRLCPTRYNPTASCPTWMAFMERVVPDDEVRNYVWRFAGYCLTGDVSEQIMLIMLGEGSNGKSTFARAIQEVMSPSYAIQLSSDLLIAKQQRSHPTEVADLFGIRLAVGIETDKGQCLDEPLIKQLTGNDRIRARRMREDYWEFEPTHKIALLTNHMPTIRGREHAMWRRLHLVRFDVTIPAEQRDKRLLQKLLAEREGILAWQASGYRQVREHGLCPPASVIIAPQGAVEEPTPAEAFIRAFVVRRPGSRVRATDLYQAFCAWCGENAGTPSSQPEFGGEMGRQGFGRKKTGGVIVYVDTLLQDPRRGERDDQGGEGPLPGLNGLEQPRDEGNRGDRPPCPQSSLLGASRQSGQWPGCGRGDSCQGGSDQAAGCATDGATATTEAGHLDFSDSTGGAHFA